jgi:SAM-dependent methyltransferase
LEAKGLPIDHEVSKVLICAACAPSDGFGVVHMVDTWSSNASRADTPSTPKKEAIKLENTGERFLPSVPSSAEIAYDHLARYRFAERHMVNKSVIDMGCGAGYGAHSLAKVACSVLGVDLSVEAVAHAAERYQASNLHYEVGDVGNLPYEDESFEAAVSFEVIEHLERPEELLCEVKRLLKKDGVFAVSTPNKQTYSNDRNRVNSYHLSEMYPLEFQELLERYFEHVQIYWQGSLAGSVITPNPKELPKDGQVTMESAQFSLPDPAFSDRFPTMLYMVAVCTNGDAPEPLYRPFLILDRDRQIYEEHDDQQLLVGQLRIRHSYMLNKQRQEANRRLQAAHKMLQEAYEMLQGERKRFREPNGHLQEEKVHLQQSDRQLQDVSEQLQETNQRLQEESRRLRQLRREIARMQSTFRWKLAYRVNVLYRKVATSWGYRGNERG